MSDQAIIRFAPSPNGALHLGHAYSALVAQRVAQALGARFLLRIEDIDIGRCRPEYEAQMLDDLRWLGLEWEEPVRRQSEHFDDYAAALRKLERLGVLYPCFASRKEIADAVTAAADSASPRDPDGVPLYPGLSKGMESDEVARLKSQGQPFTLRLDMAKALQEARKLAGHDISYQSFKPGETGRKTRSCDPEQWGDTVIARRDVPTSYHLAVVVDDALQGVTHIVRGEDLRAATDVHRVLQILLDLPEPLYHHHGLINDAEGRKLSKSHNDKSLKSLRKGGASRRNIAVLVGLAD